MTTDAEIARFHELLRRNLSQVMAERGLARKEWARKAGLVDRTLGQLLDRHSQSPTIGTPVKLARAADVPLRWLIPLEWGP